MTIYLDIKAENMPEIAADYIELETADGETYGAEYPETEYTQGGGKYASRMKGAGLYQGEYSDDAVIYSNEGIAKILGKGIRRVIVGVSCLDEGGADPLITEAMEGSVSFCGYRGGQIRSFVPARVDFEPVDGWSCLRSAESRKEAA